MLEIIAMIVLSVLCALAWSAVSDRISGRAFWRAYHRAQAEDKRNYRSGMTLEEAHRERDRVLRKFHRA